jgi:hypothetical protein
VDNIGWQTALPKCITLIFCHSFNPGIDGSSKTISGIFDTIYTKEVPAIHLGPHVVSTVNGFIGDRICQFFITMPSGDRRPLSDLITMSSPDSPKFCVDCDLTLPALLIREFGNLTISLECNGAILAERNLIIAAPPREDN